MRSRGGRGLRFEDARHFQTEGKVSRMGFASFALVALLHQGWPISWVRPRANPYSKSLFPPSSGRPRARHVGHEQFGNINNFVGHEPACMSTAQGTVKIKTKLQNYTTRGPGSP
eukprot:6465874-Amphidinium_carterae.1